MTNASQYLLLACFAIPVIGAGVLAILRARLSGEARGGRLCLIWLAVTLALLVLTGVRISDVAVVPFWGDLYGRAASLSFAFDSLSFSFALVLTGGLLVVSAMEKSLRSPVVLLAAAAGIAAASAASLPTLCLAWALVDVILFYEDAQRASRSSAQRAPRVLFARTLSTIALIAGTYLLIEEQGTVRIALLTLSPLAKGLLMAAALLRVAPYPLPRGAGRSSLRDLVATTTGGYLWLRVMSLSPGRVPGVSWLIPLGGTVLLITGALSALSLDREAGRPHALAHWVGLMLLAPLVDVVRGPRIAVVACANAVFALTAARNGSPKSEPLRVGRVAEMVLAGSEAGAPLTAGFLARWAFLSLVLAYGNPGLFVIAFLSFSLASLPAWQGVMERFREWRDESLSREWPREGGDVALVLSAGLMIVIGTWPDLLAPDIPQVVNQILLPSVIDLARAGADSVWAGMACLLGPLACGYTARRWRSKGNRSLISALKTTQAVLELDWFYSRIGRFLSASYRLVSSAISMLEGPMALGWIVVSLLLLLAYAMGG